MEVIEAAFNVAGNSSEDAIILNIKMMMQATIAYKIIKYS